MKFTLPRGMVKGHRKTVVLKKDGKAVAKLEDVIWTSATAGDAQVTIKNADLATGLAGAIILKKKYIFYSDHGKITLGEEMMLTPVESFAAALLEVMGGNTNPKRAAKAITNGWKG